MAEASYTSKTKKTSLVWEFFVRTDEQFATCNSCKKKIKAEHGNTSNLKRHLEKIHPKEFKKFDEKSEALKAKKTKAYDDEGCAPVPKQSKLDAFVKETSKWGPHDKRQTDTDKKLAEMICVDVQPLSVVEDRGFRAFVDHLQPCYRLPTRRTLRLDLIPALYKKTQQEIMGKLVDCSSLGVTIDHWTSTANDAYMAVTAHFLSPNFNVNDYCLNVMHMPESHTAENIADALLAAIKSWVPDFEHQKVPIYVVSDNASNVQAALRRLPSPQFTGLGCFAHTLQLVIDDSIKKFPSLVNVIAKAKNIVSHFHHSSKSSHKLNEMQKMLNAPQHKLKTQCPTRWNSTYYLIERLVEQKEPLNAVLSSIDKVTNLQGHEWKTATSYVSVLKPFEDATKMMSACRYSTISMVIPILNILCEKMKTTEMDIFGQEVLSQIKRRWSNYESNELFSIASFLDPRFKHFVFSNDNSKETTSKIITAYMVSNYEKLKATNTKKADDTSHMSAAVSRTCATSVESEPTNPRPSGESEHREQTPTQRHDLWATFKNLINKQQMQESADETTALIESKMNYELELFCREPLVEPSESPFDWWNIHTAQFPNLARLARVYLPIPATSVASERIFSKAGLVLSQRRTNLKPSNAEQLVFLSHNLRS